MLEFGQRVELALPESHDAKVRRHMVVEMPKGNGEKRRRVFARNQDRWRRDDDGGWVVQVARHFPRATRHTRPSVSSRRSAPDASTKKRPAMRVGNDSPAS